MITDVEHGLMQLFKFKKTLSPALAGRRIIYAPGWSEYDPSLLPKNTFVINDIPHDWLFPQVSVVIHHGGAGTTHTVTKTGIPSIVIPFAGDQFFWAQRLAQLGVAPKAKPMIKIDSQTFVHMLEEASTPAMRDKARTLSQTMTTENRTLTAVQQIEKFAQK